MPKKLNFYEGKIIYCSFGGGIFHAEVKVERNPNKQYKYFLKKEETLIPIYANGEKRAKFKEGVLEIKSSEFFD